MRTPQAVKDAAKFLTDGYATKYSHLGQYNGYEVYTLRFLEEVCIGLPEIYLYKEGEDVITLQGYEVFDIMDEAIKGTRARRKAAREAKNKQI
jgi:hypothetical protein